MIDAIGGRKVLAALLIVAVGCVTVFLKGDLPSNFLQLLQVVFGAFVVGNGIEHAAAAYSSDSVSTAPIENPLAVPQPPLDLSSIESDLALIKATSATTQQGVAVLVNYVKNAS